MNPIIEMTQKLKMQFKQHNFRKWNRENYPTKKAPATDDFIGKFYQDIIVQVASTPHKLFQSTENEGKLLNFSIKQL